jgi:hypothetical protein
MSILDGKMRTVARATALAVMLGLAISGPVMAQTEEPTEPASAAADTVTEDEGGFDDWGWFGLLGLLGLAGLRKREAQVVEPARTERIDPVRSQRVDVDPNLETRDPQR